MLFARSPFVERFMEVCDERQCARARDCHVERLTVFHVLRVSDWSALRTFRLPAHSWTKLVMPGMQKARCVEADEMFKIPNMTTRDT